MASAWSDRTLLRVAAMVEEETINNIADSLSKLALREDLGQDLKAYLAFLADGLRKFPRAYGQTIES